MDLPWAWVMNPTTVPSMGGMGETPPFLVEGSWVLGFFRDPPLLQEPIILGSLPGFNLELPDGSKGFNDPDGVYPKTVNENDVNRLAQGLVGETHPSLYTRRSRRYKKFLSQLNHIYPRLKMLLYKKVVQHGMS